MKYALINDKGQPLEIVNEKKVLADIATFPKRELKQLLKDQLLFLEVSDRLEALASQGYIGKIGKHSNLDDQVYDGVKNFVEVLKQMIDGTYSNSQQKVENK